MHRHLKVFWINVKIKPIETKQCFPIKSLEISTIRKESRIRTNCTSLVVRRHEFYQAIKCKHRSLGIFHSNFEHLEELILTMIS